MFRTAATFLSLAVVTGLFAYDLVGDYSLAAARPLALTSLALAAVLFVADAFFTPRESVETR